MSSEEIVRQVEKSLGSFSLPDDEQWPSDLKFGKSRIIPVTYRDGQVGTLFCFEMVSPQTSRLYEHLLLETPAKCLCFEIWHYHRYPWWSQVLNSLFLSLPSSYTFAFVPPRLRHVAQDAGLSWDQGIIFDHWTFARGDRELKVTPSTHATQLAKFLILHLNHQLEQCHHPFQVIHSDQHLRLFPLISALGFDTRTSLESHPHYSRLIKDHVFWHQALEFFSSSLPICHPQPSVTPSPPPPAGE